VYLATDLLTARATATATATPATLARQLTVSLSEALAEGDRERSATLARHLSQWAERQEATDRAAAARFDRLTEATLAVVGEVRALRQDLTPAPMSWGRRLLIGTGYAVGAAVAVIGGAVLVGVILRAIAGG
jgi:hypothetical protein